MEIGGEDHRSGGYHLDTISIQAADEGAGKSAPKDGELAVYRPEGECKGLYRGTDLHALQTDHPKTERKEDER